MRKKRTPEGRRRARVVACASKKPEALRRRVLTVAQPWHYVCIILQCRGGGGRERTGARETREKFAGAAIHSEVEILQDLRLSQEVGIEVESGKRLMWK